MRGRNPRHFEAYNCLKMSAFGNRIFESNAEPVLLQRAARRRCERRPYGDPAQRRALANRIRNSKEACASLLATGKLVGEGFDHPPLDTLVLAMPVSWKGTLVQYAGRLHRKHHGKTEVRIMDYVDRDVPMLARMFERRMRGYRAMGYVVTDHLAPEAIDEYVIEYDEGVFDVSEDDSS